MKGLLLIFATFVASVSWAGFEGVITTELYSNGSKMTTKWFVGTERLKLQMNYQGANGPVQVDMIMTKGSDSLVVVTDSKDYQGFSKIGSSAISSSLGIDDLLFTTNGVVEEEMVKYQASSKKHQAAVWMLELDVDLTPFAKFFRDDPAFVLIAKQGLKGFPQKSILTNHNGELIYSMTIVNTEKKELTENDFSVPVGFRERQSVELEGQK